MYILIDPQSESIKSVDHMENGDILAFVQDEEIETLPIGKLLAVTGKKASQKHNVASCTLQIGGQAKLSLHGPVILLAQKGYFLDEEIIASLVDDLRDTIKFFRPNSYLRYI